MQTQVLSSMYVSEVKHEAFGSHLHVQVAVSKNLGLQTIRLASALVLPFNTTHYAFELENYLNGFAKIP
jgi:N-acetylated-alpha-linked acidic dipeptidase